MIWDIIAVFVMGLCVLFAVRNVLVVKARTKALDWVSDNTHRVINEKYKIGGDKSIDTDMYWAWFREQGTYDQQMLAFNKWTFNQFFPNKPCII